MYIIRTYANFKRLLCGCLHVCCEEIVQCQQGFACHHNDTFVNGYINFANYWQQLLLRQFIDRFVLNGAQRKAGVGLVTRKISVLCFIVACVASRCDGEDMKNNCFNK